MISFLRKASIVFAFSDMDLKMIGCQFYSFNPKKEHIGIRMCLSYLVLSRTYSKINEIAIAQNQDLKQLM